MTWWLVVGAIVLAIAILVVCGMSLLDRMHRLQLAQRRAMLRAEQVERLQAKILVVQERAEALRESAEQVTGRAQQVRSDFARVDVPGPGQ